MFRWLQAFVHRELVSDVPPEMELCLDCGKLMCSEGEFRDCHFGGDDKADHDGHNLRCATPRSFNIRRTSHEPENELGDKQQRARNPATVPRNDAAPITPPMNAAITSPMKAKTTPSRPGWNIEAMPAKMQSTKNIAFRNGRFGRFSNAFTASCRANLQSQNTGRFTGSAPSMRRCPAQSGARGRRQIGVTLTTPTRYLSAVAT